MYTLKGTLSRKAQLGVTREHDLQFVHAYIYEGLIRKVGTLTATVITECAINNAKYTAFVIPSLESPTNDRNDSK